MKIILWLDDSVDGHENTEYFEELNKKGTYKFYRLKTVNETINQINEIFFEETIIIVSGKLFKGFINAFKSNINNLCFMPNIIIFTANKNEFLQSLGKAYSFINDKFYNSGGVQTDFEKVIEFVKNPIKENKIKLTRDNQEHFNFDYIDTKQKLALPMFYKYLIEFTEKDNAEFINFLYEKYYNKSKEIRKILDNLRNRFPEIPIELLAKYYIRMYTDDESKFYSELNNELRKNKRDNYLTYIKVLYEGVKLKSLPLAKDTELYRGARLLKKEIDKFINYSNKNKIDGLPGSIVFTKTFLSFSKDKGVACDFLDETPKGTSTDFCKVLFILEKDNIEDDNINYSLSTHADIEKLSLMSDEREVLFFPFSSFEIKEVIPQEQNKEDKDINIIKLLYLGKYLKEIDSEQSFVGQNIDLPKTEFTKEIVDFGLVEKKNIEQNNIHNLIDKFRVNKVNAVRIINPIYQVAPIYPISPLPRTSSLTRNKTISDESPITQIIPTYKKNYIIRRFRKKEDKEEIYIPPQVIHIPSIPPIPRLKNPKPPSNRDEIIDNNYIVAQFLISQNNINKPIRIINSFEQTKRKSLYIKVDNESRYKNEEEIIKNCQIKINGHRYKFDYCYKFKDPGIYTIEYIFNSNLTKTDFLFAECYNLININLFNFNSKNVTNMVCMFLECVSLKSIAISNLDTRNANDMNCMFCNCQSLTNLDLSFFNTQNVVNMSRLFFGCKSLVSINLSSFNTQNVVNMYGMFEGCESLVNLDLLNFYTQNIVNMSRMFSLCSTLKRLDLSNFNTNKTKYMNSMFYGCSSLQVLNIYNFNFKNIINMDDMIAGCFSLKIENIYCKDKTTLIKKCLIYK